MRSLGIVRGRLFHRRRHQHLHRQEDLGHRAGLLRHLVIGYRRGNPDRRIVLHLLDVGRRHLLRVDQRRLKIVWAPELLWRARWR